VKFADIVKMPSINTELGERALSKMQHEIDWKPLKERCLRTYPAWSPRQVDRILSEYQRFLALKVATRDVYDTIILAPVLLDAMWQQHVMSTQEYYNDCQMLLQANQILHYNADAAINVKTNVKAKRMELTKASLCMMFSSISTLSADTKRIWDFGSEGDSHRASNATAVEIALSLMSNEMQDDNDDDLLTTTAPSLVGVDNNEFETEGENKVTPKLHEQLRSRKILSQSPERPIDHEQQVYIYRAGRISRVQVSYPSETILNIKSKIQRKCGLIASEQYLEWEGRELEDSRTIGHYKIPGDATITLSRVKSLQHDQSELIDPNMLQPHKKQQKQDMLLPKLTQDDVETEASVDERDDLDLRALHHSSPRRCRPRPSEIAPKSPKPSRPPRQQMHEYHPKFLYSPSNATVNSFVTSSTVAPDHRRRHHAFLDKMQIEKHHRLAINNNAATNNHRHHPRQDSYTENLASDSSRDRPYHSAPIHQVYINTIMGFTISLSARASDTIQNLKRMIEEQEDIPFAKQVLILDGVPLNDSQQLGDYLNNSKDAALHILLRLQAGSNSITSFCETSSSQVVGNSTMAIASPTKSKTKGNKLLMHASGRGSVPLASADRVHRPAWR